MSIVPEIWVNDIAGNLFPDNSFITRSKDDSAFVDENGVVHLPQSGAKPNSERNRSTFPAPITERTDLIVSYALDDFTTDPTLVRDLDEMETSYDKRTSVTEDHTDTLQEDIADWMLYHWASESASQIVRTTGAARASFIAGATGNRKKITYADFLSAKRILDNQNIPQKGRCCLLPAEMYNDLFELDEIINLDKQGKPTLPEGVVARILGFDIMMRANVVSYNNAATPVKRLPDAAALTTANAAALFWHEKFVRRGKGQVNVFAEEGKAAYYGSLFSTQAKAGGRKRYTDGRGVVALVEDAA